MLVLMRDWIVNYIEAQKTALDSIPAEQVESIIQKLKDSHTKGQRIFVFGNGGSASNASHFATDLGKGASDVLDKSFNVLSLNDNVSWITAIGNDYAYEDVYLRQLQNYGQAGDIVLTFSVSGNSSNLIKAIEWANVNKLQTVALVGGNRGKLFEISSETIVIEDTHYGRVEDCQMGIAHMFCYAFMENDELKV